MSEAPEDSKGYLSQYMSSFSRRCGIPQTHYEEACFHPLQADCIVTLSKCEGGSWGSHLTANINNGYDNYNFEHDYPNEFFASVEYAERMAEKDRKMKVEIAAQDRNADSSITNGELDGEGGDEEEEEKEEKEKDPKKLNKEFMRRLEERKDESQEKERNADTLDDLVDKEENLDKGYVSARNEYNTEEEKKGLLDSNNNLIQNNDITTQTPRELFEKIKESPLIEDVPLHPQTVDERFNLLDTKYKQIAVDRWHDLIVDKKEPANLYQGFEKNLLPEGYSFPESETSEQSDNLFFNGSYEISGFDAKFKDLNITPPLLREKYQLGIWKFDNFGVVRIRDRYFTPESDKINSNDFSGFLISTSQDNIILIEKNSQCETTLVIIVDSVTLKVKCEIDVFTKDSNINAEDGFYGNMDNYFTEYPTHSELSNFLIWNKGKYLMAGVNAISDSRVFYYNIYDTELKSIICKIERTEETKTEMCHFYCADHLNPDIVYFIWVKYYSIRVGKFEVK